jgi:hypothetical protein
MRSTVWGLTAQLQHREAAAQRRSVESDFRMLKPDRRSIVGHQKEGEKSVDQVGQSGKQTVVKVVKCGGSV